MKRLLTIGIIIIIALGKFNTVTYAFGYNSVKADIMVEVKEGGSVVIIPSVNSPVPDKTSLHIKDGEMGKFEVNFNTVGIYDYTVKTVPDKRKIEFDHKVYKIKIYVTDEGGELITTIIAYTNNEKYSAHSDVKGYSPYGPERLIFKNKVPKEKPPKDNNKKDNLKKDNNHNNNKKDGKYNDSTLDKNRNPKTEDDTKMELYFLAAILASAGLFLLSVFDFVETRKMIKKVKGS